MADVTIADVRQKYPQYSDLSDDQLAHGLHDKFYSDLPFDQFASKIGYSSTPSFMEKVPAGATEGPPSAPPQLVPHDLGHLVTGGVQTAADAVLGAPRAAAQGAVDLYRAAQGKPSGPSWADNVPGPTESPEEGAFKDALAQSAPVRAAAGAAGAADRWLGENAPIAQDAIHGGLRAAGDVLSMVPGAQVGRNAVGVAGDVLGTAGRDAIDRLAGNATRFGGEVVPDQKLAADQAQAGFRTEKSHPIAEALAGDSGRTALIDHNAAVGDATVGGEAGIPAGVVPSQQALEAARAAPNAVYGRLAAQLPTTNTLSPTAAQMISDADNMARISNGSPNVAQRSALLKTQLLDPTTPKTGEQVVEEMRALRQEGYTNVGSDDVDNQALGAIQLKMARALEQHAADSLPPGATVDASQLATARTALAKNFAAQGALTGNHFDLSKLARMDQADPGTFTGGMKTAADFAAQNKSVVGDPALAYGGNGVTKDLAGSVHSILSPSTFTGLIPGLRAGARRVLTGDTEAAATGAGQRFARPEELFAEQPPTGFMLQPSPGPVYEPLQRTPNAPDRPLTPFMAPLALEHSPGPVVEPFQRNVLEGVPDRPLNPGIPPSPPLGVALSDGPAIEPAQYDMFSRLGTALAGEPRQGELTAPRHPKPPRRTPSQE